MISKKHWTITGLLFLLSAVEGFFYIGNLIFHTSSPILPGLLWSPSTRYVILILILSFLLLIIGVLVLKKSRIIVKAFNLFRQSEEKIPNFRFIAALISGLIYLMVMGLIQWRFGSANQEFKFYFNFLSAWFNLGLLQFLIFAIWLKRENLTEKFGIRYLFFGGTIFIVWLVIALSKVGLTPDDRYWNVAGVPVLAVEIVSILIFTLLLEALTNWLEKKNKSSVKRNFPWIDLSLCVFLWLFAIILWVNAPFGNSFFAPGPYPPNNDFYPYSDARLMDLSGQYMLIGEGLNTIFVTEKALYSFFIGLIHLIAGQNYLTSTAFQIVFFAVLPVLMYLLGKKIGGRFLGLFTALFAILKERNAIISTFKISVSNSRLYLTEFPTAIGMVALSLFLFIWFRNPHKRPHIIVIAGGVLGFSSMVRTNPLVLIPLILAISIFVYRFQWRKWLMACVYFMLGFVIVISPWMIYDQVTEGTNYYYSKIINVIHRGLAESPNTNQPNLPPITPEPSISDSSTTLPSPAQQSAEEEANNQMNIIGLGKILAGHFFNNEIKALFILPFQAYPQNLNALISETYWKEPIEWEGFLTLDGVIAFALNFSLIALGISFAWSKWRFGGLVPLIVNIGYYLSNALARTSGSRYLLPVDWTIYFYYCAGIAFIILKIILNRSYPDNQTDDHGAEIYPKPKRLISPVLISCVVLFFLGCSMPIVNASFPKRYGNLSNQEILNKLAETDFMIKTGVDFDTLSDFIANNDGLILYGRGLYPRYLTSIDEVDPGLYFNLINSESKEIFIAMDTAPAESIAAGKDFIIIGCQRENYVEGLFVHIDDQNGTIIQASQLDKDHLSCINPINR